ncbi:DegT/DnrJ/EryC1/StrS family aminotransferase [Alphaproteobacteria bacterium]|nr:DegT/DnrJ/EryC1/StrS family aminotransferase [Alphaproteobacteria bacterium]
MSRTISFIDLGKQQKRLGSKIQNRINLVLSHGKYIMGPEVNELEEKLEQYTGAKHAVTCASGTDALVLALMAYGIGSGDIVFCPTFTFPATAEAIVILGAIPYFIDVEADTFNISMSSLKKGIENVKKENQYKIKAIISVDLYGLPANYSQLNIIAKENNMIVIADAAQSFGAEHNNKKVGTLSDITCVSFFPAKPLGCYGDGGAILTNDIIIKDKVKSLRAHGKGTSKYDIDYVGLNSRLDTIQAGILLAKLEGFEWERRQRNTIAENYSKALNKKISIPKVPDGLKSIWAQYTVKHDNRAKIQESLKEKGIPTMVYYPIPMHMQKAYRKYYNNNFSLVNSEVLANQVFSLPMYPDMSEDDQYYIIKNILNLL